VTLTLSETFDDGGAGVIDATFTEIRLVITYTTPLPITWWDAPTGGTQVGTGSPFETVGTTVLPTTGTPGTYMFYAQSTSGTCSSASRLAISVNVNPVLVSIAAVNVTCQGAGNGTFTLGTVSCGVSPFTYSVNGGAFGAIPTNLTPGVYSVIAKDASANNSPAMSITISEPNWTVPNATAVGGPFSTCVNSTSKLISASATISQTITVQFPLSSQPVDVLSTPGVMISTATMSAIPAGATITSATLTSATVTPQGGSWQSEVNLGLTGAVNSPGTGGVGALNAGGVFNYTRPVPAGTINFAGGTVNLLYFDTFNDVAAGPDANFVLGANSVTLTINYTLPSTITWYDASTGGTVLGTSSPLETVGTSVLPTTSTPGVYNFYAEGTYLGCTSPSRTLITVTVNALPIVTATAPSTVCAGAMVTLNGGGASTYVWDNSVTNNVAFAASTTTTYGVIGTDVNGCTNTSSTVLTVNQLPVASSTYTPILCNGGTSTVTVSATGGTGTLTGTGTFTLPAGPYSYTVTDSNSCTSVATTGTITQPTPITVAFSSTTILCNGDSSAVAISASGGTGALTGQGTFNQAGGTTIIYTVTDANACIGTASVAITQPTAIAVTATSGTILCYGGSTSVSIAATGGTGALTITGGPGPFTLSAGTTVYNVTDANGCTGTTTLILTQPALFLASSTITSPIACNGGMGTVTVSATGGVTSYSGVGPFFQAVGATTYVVTDGNGCTAATSTTLSEPSAIVVSYSTTGILCNGDSSGVTISATGGTPSYTSGIGTFSQAVGTAGYTVTDANGCTATDSVTLTQPTAIIVTATSGTISCFGGTTSVAIAATGGTGTLTVTGGPGPFTQSAGMTTYTVTDANLCTSTTNVTLTQPTAVMLMFSSTPILCNGDSSAVTIIGMDGTPTYTGEGTFNQAAGVVSYSITDANGCLGSANYTVTQPAAITTAQSANLCAGQSVIVGTNTYTTAGTYIDIMTASNTCDSTITTTVTTTTIDATTNTSGAVITSNSSTGTFQWLDCNLASAPIAGETNQAYTSTANGSYAVQVTDNGCVDTSACVIISTTAIENNSENQLSVYPNPTIGIFNIAISNASISELVITIVDIQGKEVFSSVDKNVNGEFNKQIDLEELSKGLYYIKVNTGTDVMIQKLIVQ